MSKNPKGIRQTKDALSELLESLEEFQSLLLMMPDDHVDSLSKIATLERELDKRDRQIGILSARLSKAESVISNHNKTIERQRKEIEKLRGNK